jgi:hypothetical protein
MYEANTAASSSSSSSLKSLFFFKEGKYVLEPERHIDWFVPNVGAPTLR